MGNHYEFTCGKCGYRCEVSGGDDFGMVCCTTTVVCHDCHKLYDIVTSENAAADHGKRSDIFNRHCPRSKKHRIEKWSHPGKCPKCGEIMEVGECLVCWD